MDPDRGEVSEGIYAWLAGGDPARNNPADRGTIAAWAWGFHRCVDYLVTEPGVDPHRIAALGHSRNGKTALLAAAFDERIAIAFPHQAGCGGSAPSRGKTGESVKAINDAVSALVQCPVQAVQRCPGAAALRPELPGGPLRAAARCCSPRPKATNGPTRPASSRCSRPPTRSIVSSAAKDWLRRKSRPSANWCSPLGYYVREGKHSMTADDWTVFMNFADAQWRK